MMLTSGLNNILSVIRGLPGAATDGLVAGFGGEFRDSQAFADAFEQALQLEPQLPGEANTASAFELLQSLLEEGNPLPLGGNPSPFNSDAAEAGLSVDAATRAIPSNLSGASVAGTDLFSEGAVSDAEAARKLADLFEQRSLGSKASVASATAEPIPPTGEAANATPERNSEASDEALSALLAKRLTAATAHTDGGKTNSTAAASFTATSANTA
ncbi:MAG: hypothetical protein V2I45_06875, partial [Halieaceae bacterium]|nr:hypothetical protein [Halieaceae bacterium]